jgi:hypothetical protein
VSATGNASARPRSWWPITTVTDWSIRERRGS